MKTYDWIIVGGGIAGISLCEILTREGHSVALIEKNNKLASETTREFHEWVHTGSLYTFNFIVGAYWGSLGSFTRGLYITSSIVSLLCFFPKRIEECL